jgi:hypothetical protein
MLFVDLEKDMACMSWGFVNRENRTGSAQGSLELVIACVRHGIAEVDEELRQATFRGSVVAEDVREGRVSQGLW